MSEEDNVNVNRRQVAWSADAEVSKQIMKMIEFSNSYYMIKEYGMQFDALKACKHLCSYSLSEDEKKELEKLETDTKFERVGFDLKKRQDWKYKLNEEEQKSIQKIISIYGYHLKEKVEKYNQKIMELLGAYGYLTKFSKNKGKLRV